MARIQDAPQSTTYTKKADKKKTAKPVGARFTNKLAKRLGKKNTTKPSASDIEKYLGKGVYKEKRKDKSDLNPKDKFAKGGQASPQSESYTARADKKKTAKPVGVRFTDKLANRLGKKPTTKPTLGEAEKYMGKGVYKENRKDKSDINPKNRFAKGGGVKDFGSIYQKVVKYIAKDQNISYEKASEIVDDNESWLKNMVEYEGETNISFLAENILTTDEGEYAKGGTTQTYAQYPKTYNEFRDITKEAKPVGYRYTDALAKRLGVNPLSKPSNAHVEKYLDKGVYWENRADKSDQNPKRKLEGGGENEYAKGGKLTDKFVEAYYYGDRFGYVRDFGYAELEVKGKDKEIKLVCLAKIMNIYDATGDEQFEKTPFELTFEIVPQLSQIDKKHIEDALEGNKPSKGNDLYGDIFEGYMSGVPLGVLGKNFRLFSTFEEAEDYLMSSDVNQEITVSSRLVGFVLDRPVNRLGTTGWSYLTHIVDKSHDQYSFAKGGQAPSYKETYFGNKWTRKADKEEKGKRVGYRYTDKLAKRLGVNKYAKPTDVHIEKYLGNGIYFENRKDKSDVSPKDKLAKGGYVAVGEKDGYWVIMSKPTTKEMAQKVIDMGVPIGEVGKVVSVTEAKAHKKTIGAEYLEYGGYMAMGGTTQTYPQSQSYNEFRDIQKDAKPVGYRYTDALAKRLGVSPLSKPSKAHIDKYLDKGVYWENRADKSDQNRKDKLEDGGEMAKGGGTRISNSEASSYAENHQPFRGNNLEAKTLENGDYVVLSYGYYPIWYWNKKENKWYQNKDKFSQTTARHITASRPTYDAQVVSRNEMDNMMAKSLEGNGFMALGGELSSFVVTQ